MTFWGNKRYCRWKAQRHWEGTVLGCSANCSQSAEETEAIKQSPRAYSIPCKEMRLPWPWCYHSPRTAKLSYLSMSSPLVSGALPRAALLRLWSVPCSVWRRGFVSDPGLRGPATQLSDTSWPSEEPAGWLAAAGKGGGSGGGGGAAVGGGGTTSLFDWSASSVSEITTEGCSGLSF